MPIPAVTYVLSTAYAGGVISAKAEYGGGGQTFDILAALVAGGGDAKGVGGSFSITDADIAAALDASPVLSRSGAAAPPAPTNPVISPVLASETVKADGDMLVRSGATFGVLAKPGSPLGDQLVVRTDGTVAWQPPPAFHVSAWGGLGDNSNDDQPAVQGAVTACENAGGGRVVLGGKNGKVNKLGSTGPIQFQRNGTAGVIGSRGWVVIDGSGARLQGTATVYRAFDTPRVADYDCFARIWFEKVHFDGANVARVSNNHGLVGCLKNGAWDQRLNFRYFVFNACRTTGLPAANTDGDASGTTGSRQSVSLVSRHLGAGEATQTFVRDIYDFNCEFSGGVGVAAGGSGAGSSGVNVYCDRLVSVNLTHDTGVTPTAPPLGAKHASIQHGLTGFGGSSTVIGLRSFNSNDVALEQDEMQTVYNEDCIVQDAWNVAYLPTAFGSGRVDLSSQVYRYVNCHNRVVNIDPPATSQFLGNAYGWCVSGSQTINHVILDGCSNVSKAPSMQVNGEAICVPEKPLRKLTLRDFKAIHETVNYSPGAAPTWSFIRYGPSIANEFEAHGVHYSLGGTYGGPAASFPFIVFEGAGPTTISYDDPVYENTMSAAGCNFYPEWYGKYTSTGANSTLTSGAVRRRKARNFTSTASTNVRVFADSPALTITNDIVDQDCDHSGFPSATAADVLFAAGNNARPKVKSRGGTAIKSTTVASASTITLPDKADRVTVTGTTNITSITASWADRFITLHFSGALTLTNGSNLLLNGDFVTANTRQILLRCDGTNWIEVSRSNTAITANGAWDPPSTASGAFTSTTITATGAAVGDVVAVGFTPAVPAGVMLTAEVTAANTVTVTLYNISGSTQDLASGTLTVKVLK